MAQALTVRASYAGPTDTKGSRVTVRANGYSHTAPRNFALNFDAQARGMAFGLATRVYGDGIIFASETSTHNGDRYVYTFERVTR